MRPSQPSHTTALLPPHRITIRHIFVIRGGGRPSVLLLTAAEVRQRVEALEALGLVACGVRAGAGSAQRLDRPRGTAARRGALGDGSLAHLDQHSMWSCS